MAMPSPPLDSVTAKAAASKAGRGVRMTGLACLTLAVAMVGAAFAAVPLYNIFCKATGFDGTPLVGTSEAKQILERTINVRLDSNVSPGLAWSFKQETPSVEARLGETQTVFFQVKNEGATASTGIAAFNVQPGQAGAFFVKLKCFCFEDQRLEPGESREFPVVFYVDPAIAQEHSLDDLSMITLSYTYLASKNGLPVVSADGGAKPRL
jgi:cytochrome c oxidase assembly protein subunit 11